MYEHSDYLREQAAKYLELAKKRKIHLLKANSSNWRRYAKTLPMIWTTGASADDSVSQPLRLDRAELPEITKQLDEPISSTREPFASRTTMLALL
jgi:hypothetical protein